MKSLHLRIVLVILAAAAFVHAQPPATEPNKAPAQPAAPSISSEAKAVLDEIRTAYKNLKSLNTRFTLSSDFVADDDTTKESVGITSQYVAPNKFRYSLDNDITVGSDGQKLYAFKPAEKVYSTAPLPADRKQPLPDPYGELTTAQDPSLAVALADDPVLPILYGFNTVARGEDVTIDGVAYVQLKLGGEYESAVYLIDPKTHLIRRVIRDVAKELIRNGRTGTKKADLLFDYTQVSPDVAIDEAQFAWTPPADSRDLATMDAFEAAKAWAAALTGKPAPDFSLEGLDGKIVKLADLRGKVVVIDFWATWCVPCRPALQHLQKVMDDYQGKEVAFFAIDMDEKKDRVQKFVEASKLRVPVLLDKGGSVAAKYNVSLPPVSFVIGPDGKLTKAFVGYDHEHGEQNLRDAIEKAMTP